MTKATYLDMMEQMGLEPKKEEIPPDYSDFMSDTIKIFEINNHLKDIWDGFSGSYLGKDLSTLPMLFDMYEITSNDTRLVYMYLLNVIMDENSKIINNRIKQEHKTKGAK